MTATKTVKMAKIPQSVLEQDPPLEGLELIGRGKVRDSYRLPGHIPQRLVRASDRISIFDFVLPARVPDKGAVLTALNHFWTMDFLLRVCHVDMLACGGSVNAMLPANLRNNRDLLVRSSVVRQLPGPLTEDIVRFHLTGSGFKSYKKDGTVCGHKLPPGLRDGERLPEPLYTPTDKAEEGHDVDMTVDEAVKLVGPNREPLAKKCALVISEHARKKGIILADTKFEFSGDTLIDERGTPDSSRYWDADTWSECMSRGVLPPPFDKQLVREWGKTEGIDKLDPKNPEHVARVHSLEIPEDIIRQTTVVYHTIFYRLTGLTLEDYQRDRMGIRIPKPALAGAMAS